MSPFMLMIALSVHSLFEGIAVGIESHSTALYSLIAGLVIHKAVAAISIGVSFSKSFKTQHRTPIQLIIVFSVSTPIGITLGMLLEGTEPLVDVVFSSLAAGTFVFIACTEVIVAEFSLPGDRGVKYIMLILGALAIAGLWFLG